MTASASVEPGRGECSLEVRAAPEKVWAALTEQSALTVWFAEKAEVEPRVGGAFRFWGRHTPTLGYAGPADQTITAFEPNQRLAFTWTWGGVPGACELALEPDGEHTTVRVRHTWNGDLHPCITTDFWSLSLHNLDHYLRTGAPALLPDHGPFRETAELTIEIEAPAERVWTLLTTPGEMKRFLGTAMDCDPAVDLRVGGVYSYGWNQDGKPIGPREILELDPGRRLLHSWTCDDGETMTRTEWTVEPLGETKCALTVRQFGLADEKDMNGYVNGWSGYLLAIKRETETG